VTNGSSYGFHDFLRHTNTRTHSLKTDPVGSRSQDSRTSRWSTSRRSAVRSARCRRTLRPRRRECCEVRRRRVSPREVDISQRIDPQPWRPPAVHTCLVSSLSYTWNTCCFLPTCHVRRHCPINNWNTRCSSLAAAGNITC